MLPSGLVCSTFCLLLYASPHLFGGLLHQRGSQRHVSHLSALVIIRSSARRR
jgi:hypothetical protein